MKATVTSPAVPPASRAGRWTRYNVEGFRSSHFGNVMTFLGSKYFQLRIVLADAEPGEYHSLPTKGSESFEGPFMTVIGLVLAYNDEVRFW